MLSELVTLNNIVENNLHIWRHNFIQASGHQSETSAWSIFSCVLDFFKKPNNLYQCIAISTYLYYDSIVEIQSTYCKCCNISCLFNFQSINGFGNFSCDMTQVASHSICILSISIVFWFNIIDAKLQCVSIQM